MTPKFNGKYLSAATYGQHGQPGHRFIGSGSLCGELPKQERFARSKTLRSGSAVNPENNKNMCFLGSKRLAMTWLVFGNSSRIDHASQSYGAPPVE